MNGKKVTRIWWNKTARPHDKRNDDGDDEDACKKESVTHKSKWLDAYACFNFVCARAPTGHIFLLRYTQRFVYSKATTRKFGFWYSVSRILPGTTWTTVAMPIAVVYTLCGFSAAIVKRKFIATPLNSSFASRTPCHRYRILREPRSTHTRWAENCKEIGKKTMKEKYRKWSADVCVLTCSHTNSRIFIYELFE